MTANETEPPSHESRGTLRERVLDEVARNGAQAAAALIGSAWDRYSATAPAELLDAVRALPGEILIDNPGLIVAANYLQQLVAETDPDRVERTQQFSITPASGSTLAQQLVILTGTSATQRMRGDFADARASAADARRRFEAASDVETAKLLQHLPHLFVQWGRSLETAGDGRGEAHHEYEESYRLALHTEQHQAGRRAAGHLAWYLAERGRLRAAQDWLRRARDTGEAQVGYDAVIHLTAALIHTDGGDRGAAAVDLARMSVHPIGDYWAAALWVRSTHAATAEERALVEADLEVELARRPPAIAGGAMNAHYLRAAAVNLGRFGVDEREWTTPGDAALNAIAAYRRGAFHAVIDMTQHAIGPEASPRIRAAALLLHAAAAAGLNRSSAASEHFERARAIIDREGLFRTYDLIDVDALEDLAGSRGVPVSASVVGGGEAALLSTLSKREQEVLVQLVSDRSLAVIAGDLFVSPNTLKTTVRRLYRKLGVNSRQEAADIAHRAGLRPQPPR
ncbi:LuxR family transcriptional regulator [Labedella phragmitis]|uniref:LuxR family transcriptional regulator n=1 Tax=Labedella phragmitis TaxID=2498849 RepID=A0A444PYC3_9MICO|nr:LuxR C-terminal-related transcriptional regulator [Labedella phragmitis]RWZ52876.1 LuxR family transcriptional regulator [Labedella phragmitis]